MDVAQEKTESRQRKFPWRWLGVILLAVIIAVWLGFTPEGVFGKTDAVGYAVCHRIDARSFHFAGRQFSLCARCTGQYLGALTGLAFQALYRPRRSGSPPKRVIAVLVLLAGLYGLDGLNSYVQLPVLLKALPGIPHLYEPSNVFRVLTGTGMGLVLATALFPAFNSTLYRQPHPSPAIPGLRSFLLMAAITLVVGGLSLTSIDWILLPLSLISALGVIVLLVMVYTMVLLMIFRRDNHYERVSQAIYPLLGALGMTIIQIAVLDIGRFLLTGTWGEIPFQ